MKSVLKTIWRSFVKFVEAFDTGSSYPFEQIRELQLEVAKLKAAGAERVVSTDR